MRTRNTCIISSVISFDLVVLLMCLQDVVVDDNSVCSSPGPEQSGGPGSPPEDPQPAPSPKSVPLVLSIHQSVVLVYFCLFVTTYVADPMHSFVH